MPGNLELVEKLQMSIYFHWKAVQSCGFVFCFFSLVIK